MKNNKGITLTSLIVTIIVMVILAGIALLFSVGEEGIIERTNQATKQNQESGYEEQIELVISSYSILSYKGENVNYKKIANDILDIFEYPNIDEDTGLLLDEQAGTTSLYTMTAKEGLVVVLSNNQEPLLRIEYNDLSEIIVIEYNGKAWTYEGLKLIGVEEIKYVEYNAPEEAVGSEFKSGLWQYIKNESGTLTITKYLGKTAEELIDVVVPNRINGQVVEYFDGFGKNLTGTLTISKGLKTLDKQGMNQKLANIKLNKLVIEEDVVMKSGYFFRYGTINEIEIKDNVILDADVIFSAVSTNNIVIGNNVQILYNGFRGCSSKQVKIGNNCIIKNHISTENLTIGDNADISITVDGNLKALTIGKNATMNAFSGATNLSSVTVGKNINLVGNNLFSKSELLTNEDVNAILRNSNETVNGQGLFLGCIGLTDITIAKGKIVSGKNMFSGCTNLKKLKIEENCKFLSWETFSNLKIDKLIIANNVEFSGYLTFSGGKFLENVEIGENCKLTFDFFNNCGIKNVIIGKGTEGKATTFLNCTLIENVTYYLTDEQINLCKQDMNNVNKIITSESIFQRIRQHNPSLTATFEEDKIVLRKVES